MLSRNEKSVSVYGACKVALATAVDARVLSGRPRNMGFKGGSPNVDAYGSTKLIAIMLRVFRFATGVAGAVRLPKNGL